MDSTRRAIRTMKALERLAEDVKALKEGQTNLERLISALVVPEAKTGQMEKRDPRDSLEKALKQAVQIKPKQRGRPAKNKP